MSSDTGFSRPTLQQLIDRIAADFNTRFPDSDAKLRRSVPGVLARSLAGLAHGLYGYLDYIARQILPDTADTIHLVRHASIYGYSRKAAAKSTGTTTVTGNVGAIIPAATSLITAEGSEFVTTEEVILGVTETADIAIESVDTGESQNIDAGVTLTFTSPLVGVDATSTVVSVSGGEDIETDDSLRARLLDRLRQPPMGGADYDYKAWALEIKGVTRAWVYPLELGLGTVTVRFMTDDLTGTGIPDAAKVTEVDAYLQEKRPVTSAVTVVAPISVPLDFDIDLLNEDGDQVTDTTIRAEVEAELADMLLRDAVPGGTILVSHIREAISIAAGEYDHVLNDPSADVIHSTGEIATMGTVAW